MAQPTFTIQVFNADGSELELALPAKFELCPRCQGVGTHVNPSIDGNGLTREDFDQDPDFEESYFRGDYDVQCSVCQGERVVSKVDFSRLTPAQKRHLARHEKAMADLARDEASEHRLRMAESGERW